MGFFESLNSDKFVISLERPCKYTGDEILRAIRPTLSDLIDKELEENITEDEIQTKLWLSRLEKVVSKDIIYRLTIDEAVRIGLLV